MRLFISSEAQVPAANLIADIQKKIGFLIGEIDIADYSKEIDRVAIIVNCFDETWMSSGHGKERKYISYKGKYADIRLNIPFDEFMRAESEKRYLMVVKNIINSIDVIGEKAKKSKRAFFDSDALAEYILSKLELTRNDLVMQ